MQLETQFVRIPVVLVDGRKWMVRNKIRSQVIKCCLKSDICKYIFFYQPTEEQNRSFLFELFYWSRGHNFDVTMNNARDQCY